MAGRTPKEAVDNFVGPLQLAISCVTPSVVVVSGGNYVSSTPHVATIGDGGPISLQGDSLISLVIRQHYRIVEDSVPRGPWKVSTAGYLYSLKETSTDREILAYHWHPAVGVTFPHLHLEAGALVGREELAEAHLPTNRVALEDVLRLAISSFGVRPLRNDWANILDSTQAAFEEWRTWAGSGPPSVA